MATENTFPGVHPLPETSHKKITTTVKKCVLHAKARSSVMHVQKVFSLKPFSAFLALSSFSPSRFAKDSNKQTKGSGP